MTNVTKEMTEEEMDALCVDLIKVIQACDQDCDLRYVMVSLLTVTATIIDLTPDPDGETNWACEALKAAVAAGKHSSVHMSTIH